MIGPLLSSLALVCAKAMYTHELNNLLIEGNKFSFMLFCSLTLSCGNSGQVVENQWLERVRMVTLSCQTGAIKWVAKCISFVVRLVHGCFI